MIGGCSFVAERLWLILNIKIIFFPVSLAKGRNKGHGLVTPNAVWVVFGWMSYVPFHFHLSIILHDCCYTALGCRLELNNENPKHWIEILFKENVICWDPKPKKGFWRSMRLAMSKCLNVYPSLSFFERRAKVVSTHRRIIVTWLNRNWNGN